MSSLKAASEVVAGLVVASARSMSGRAVRRRIMTVLLEILSLGVVARVEGDAEPEPRRDPAVVRLEVRSVAQHHLVFADLEIPRLRQPVAQRALEPEVVRDPQIGQSEDVETEPASVHGVDQVLGAGG